MLRWPRYIDVVSLCCPMNDQFRLRECCVREHLIRWTVSKIMFRQARILTRQWAGQSGFRIPTDVRDFSVL